MTSRQMADELRRHLRETWEPLDGQDRFVAVKRYSLAQRGGDGRHWFTMELAGGQKFRITVQTED